MNFVYLFALCGLVGVCGNNILAPSDPRLHWFGRKHLEPARAQFDWIGVGFSLRLASDSSPGTVSVEIDGRGERFAVYNGQTQIKDFFATTPYSSVYILGTAKPGDVITLVKTTEKAVVSVFSVHLSTGVNIAPFGTPPSRRIEFWGDSGSAAYAVDSTSWDILRCAQNGSKFENFAHGWIHGVTQSLGAEAQVQAISGIGVARNCGGGFCSVTPETLPQLVGRTLHNVDKDDYDASVWQPDLIVVYVGDNDYEVNWFNEPSESEFTAAYKGMMEHIVKPYPSVPVLHLCSPAMTPNVQCGYIKAFAAAAGQQYSTTLEANGFSAGGCAGHLTAKQQAALAVRIAPVIAKAAGWDKSSEPSVVV